MLNKVFFFTCSACNCHIKYYKYFTYSAGGVMASVCIPHFSLYLFSWRSGGWLQYAYLTSHFTYSAGGVVASVCIPYFSLYLFSWRSGGFSMHTSLLVNLWYLISTLVGQTLSTWQNGHLYRNMQLRFNEDIRLIVNNDMEHIIWDNVLLLHWKG